MTWAKFEDRFPWHRKVRGLSDAAFRLHVSAVCWSCEHLTDGAIPADDLPLVSDVKRTGPAVAELVRRGLWDEVQDGWEVHDFLIYNESREVVLARREADAERKRKGREGRKPKGSPSGVRLDVRPDSPPDSTRESVRTGPSRTEPKNLPPTAGDAASPTPGQRAQRLAKGYTDRVPLSAFLAVRAVVAKAIGAGYSDDAVESALSRLVDEGRGVTADSLRIALEGPPRRRAVGDGRASATEAEYLEPGPFGVPQVAR